MYKPFTYLWNLFSYLSTYTYDLLLTEWVTKVKPNSNSVEVHPQMSHTRHPSGWFVGVLVHSGRISCWWSVCHKVLLSSSPTSPKSVNQCWAVLTFSWEPLVPDFGPGSNNRPGSLLKNFPFWESLRLSEIF
jgi:hypothetical protein